MCKRIFMHRWWKWRLAELFLNNSSCLDFPGGLDGKEFACNVGHLGSIPGLGSPEGENGNHSSILAWEIPWTEDAGGLQCVGSQRVGRDWTTKHCQLPDEAVNGYSRQRLSSGASVWLMQTVHPGWSVSAVFLNCIVTRGWTQALSIEGVKSYPLTAKEFPVSAFQWLLNILNITRVYDPRRRKWQPTPVFLPGESHGQRSLEGYSAWGRRVRHELATEHTHTLWASFATLNNAPQKLSQAHL